MNGGIFKWEDLLSRSLIELRHLLKISCMLVSCVQLEEEDGKPHN